MRKFNINEKLVIILEIVFLIMITFTTASIQYVEDRIDTYENVLLLKQNELLDLSNHYVANYLTVLRIENAQFFGVNSVKFGTLGEDVSEKPFVNIEEEKNYRIQKTIEHAKDYDSKREIMNYLLLNEIECLGFKCSNLRDVLIVVQLASIIILLILLFYKINFPKNLKDTVLK